MTLYNYFFIHFFLKTALFSRLLIYSDEPDKLSGGAFENTGDRPTKPILVIGLTHEEMSPQISQSFGDSDLLSRLSTLRSDSTSKSHFDVTFDVIQSHSFDSRDSGKSNGGSGEEGVERGEKGGEEGRGRGRRRRREKEGEREGGEGVERGEKEGKDQTEVGQDVFQDVEVVMLEGILTVPESRKRSGVDEVSGMNSSNNQIYVLEGTVGYSCNAELSSPEELSSPGESGHASLSESASESASESRMSQSEFQSAEGLSLHGPLAVASTDNPVTRIDLASEPPQPKPIYLHIIKSSTSADLATGFSGKSNPNTNLNTGHDSAKSHQAAEWLQSNTTSNFDLYYSLPYPPIIFETLSTTVSEQQTTSGRQNVLKMMKNSLRYLTVQDVCSRLEMSEVDVVTAIHAVVKEETWNEHSLKFSVVKARELAEAEFKEVERRGELEAERRGELELLEQVCPLSTYDHTCSTILNYGSLTTLFRLG